MALTGCLHAILEESADNTHYTVRYCTILYYTILSCTAVSSATTAHADVLIGKGGVMMNNKHFLASIRDPPEYVPKAH